MPNKLALENNYWFGPKEIAGLTTAFEAALAKLGLVDRSDPTTLTLAKLIIELAKAGECEPERLCASALKRLSKPPSLVFETARAPGAVRAIKSESHNERLWKRERAPPHCREE
jgi:hypothetical protein